MVNRGQPSKDCAPCRRRKLRCDLCPRGCGQCTRAAIECFGYRTAEELRFKDQTQSVKRKNRASRLPTGIIVLSNKPGIIRQVTPAWDDFARHNFFTNYVFGLSKSYDALGILFKTANPPQHLLASVDAASLAFLAVRHFNTPKEIVKLGAERYVTALQLVNQALASPSACLTDDTLQAVLLLDLYEKLANHKLASPNTWMRHMNGAISLIRARGDRNLKTYVGRRLTRRLYTTLVISCAVSGSSIPIELDELKSSLDRFYSEENDPKWRVTTLNVHVINMAADIRAGKLSSHDIVVQASKLKGDIAEIENSLPISWHPRRIPINRRPDQDTLTLSGYYDYYECLFHTQVRNVIRVIKLNLSLIVLQHARTDDDSPSLGVETRKSIEECVQEICASVPQHLVCSSGSQIRKQELFPPMQQLSCYTLLLPLYLAAQATNKVHVKDWILGAFTQMADPGGLAMAQKTADVLKYNPTMAFWEVYAMLGSYAIAA